MLGGKSVLVDIIVMIVPVYFNLLLGNNYACSMNVVVSSLFCVMHCTQEGGFETFDQLSYCDCQPFLTLDHAMPFSAHTKSNRIVFLGNTMSLEALEDYLASYLIFSFSTNYYQYLCLELPCLELGK